MNENNNQSVGFYKFTWSHDSNRNSATVGQSWFLTFINIICGLVFLTVLRWFRYRTGQEFEIYDQETVTASDYSAEVDISDKMFNKFIKKFEKKMKNKNSSDDQNKISLVYEFKTSLIKTIERQITNIPAISKEIESTAISSLYFSFNNKEIIDLLSQRGGFLISGDIIKAKDFESKIEEIIEKHYYEMGVPTTAFIIFEEEEAWQRALSIGNDQITFWDETLDFKMAPEPSDVIWEYHNQSNYEFWRKSAIAICIVLGVVFMNFWIVFLLKSWVIHDYGDFNWDFIDKLYPTKDSLLKSAINEAYAYSKRGNKSSLKGALKWFWDQEWKNNGFFAAKSTEYSHSGIKNKSGEEYIDNICYEYLVNSYMKTAIEIFLGIFIFVMNIIMKQIIDRSVKWIGFTTQSMLNNALILARFTATFINTAIILIVRKGSIEGSSFPYFGVFVDSVYYDFDLDWYREIGEAIVIDNFFVSISPFIDFCFDYLLQNIERLNDKRSFSWDKYRTKWKSIQQYVDLYGGFQYKLYTMYSYIISMSWITFMFGTGLPLLYPWFLFTLIMIWVYERLMLAYYYKYPPMFDDKLSNTTVDFWSYAFLIQMFFGFRMFNNSEMFEVDSNSSEYSYLSGIFFNTIEFNHAFPFLAFLGLFVIFTIWESYYIKVNKIGNSKWGFEGLPPFPKCLKQSDVEWMYSEEKYLRDNENIKILSDKFYNTLETMQNLGEAKDDKGEHKIQQIATYDILANPIYQEMFQYYSVDERGAGSDPIFMSNKVRKILNLPYLSQNQISEFRFIDTLFNKMVKK